MSAPAVTIPDELRSLRQWVNWRAEQRDGRPTKVPYCAADPSRPASSTDPATWATFDQAVEASAEIGFVFTADDPFVGIDLDNAVDESGELAPDAAAIVERLDSYTERSPSGRGLHVIVKGRLNGARRRTGNFEVYERGRYFTMTGERVGARDSIEERQEQLDALVGEMFPPESTLPSSVGDGAGLATPDDRELLERAFAAKNGGKVQALYRGELNGHAQGARRISRCALRSPSGRARIPLASTACSVTAASCARSGIGVLATRPTGRKPSSEPFGAPSSTRRAPSRR